ncbi:MAG: SH3 domain-containing protein [Tabrizicola sp.]
MTLILCIGMYAALMIAGQDRGQLRPGLADAAAKAALQGTVQADAAVPETAEIAAAAPVAEPAAEPVVAATAEEPATPPAVEPAAPVVAEATPEPAVEPARTVVTEVEEPVFSLASVGNEAVPGEGSQQAATPEVMPDGEGTIWYVNASSVNVRAEPSTEAEIVGRLGSGEATLMVQAVNDEWARIVIQGDGVEGFVAMRYLSAEAP